MATAILDGEAVVLDEQGRPKFGLLQQSLGGRSGKRTSGEALFMAFDLLHFDGHDLTEMELSARRHLLEGLIIGHEGIRHIKGCGTSRTRGNLRDRVKQLGRKA